MSDTDNKKPNPNPQPLIPSFAAVIMAAGKGKRMKSGLPKVLHKLDGRPLIDYVMETALKCGAERVIAVVGRQRELVMEHIGGGAEFAVQDQQLGTGHAVQMTEPLLRDFPGSVLILSGDVPLLRTETIEHLSEFHRREGNVCTLISCEFEDPSGYGRIIRGGAGEVTAIVEHKDASPEQLKIKEINSGIYLVESKPLFRALESVRNDNAQGEYYLTDIVEYFVEKGFRVGGLPVEDPYEIAGVNSVGELKILESEYLRRNQ